MNLKGQTLASVESSSMLELTTGAGWLITVENDYSLTRAGEPPLLTEDGEEDEIAEVLTKLVGTAISVFTISPDGGLTVALPGAVLRVAMSPDVEAWSVLGPDDERVVSMPGGTLVTSD